MSPNSELHGVAVGILNDSANDPYRAESSGGQKISTYRLLRRSLGIVSAAEVRKWTIEFLQVLKIDCWLNFVLR